MHILAQALRSHPAVTELLGSIRARAYPAAVTGLSHIHKAALTLTLLRCAETDAGVSPHAPAGRALLLTGDEAESARLAEDLTALGLRVLVLPAREWTLRRMESASHGWEHRRVGVLSQVLEGGYDVVLACADAACAHTLPPDVLAAHTLTLAAGKPLPSSGAAGTSGLPAALVSMGYRRVDQIESGAAEPEEAAGTFAVRGGILDIFPPGAPAPVRLELWGDEVDSLARFDPATQRRTEEIAAVILPPAAENICADAGGLADRLDALAAGLRGTAKTADAVEKARARLSGDGALLRGGETVPLDAYSALLYPPATLFDYMPGALLLVSEPARVRERLRTTRWQLEEDVKGLLEEGQLCRGLGDYLWEPAQLTAHLQARAILLDTFARSTPELKLASLHHVNARQLPVWSGALELLADDLRDALHRKLSCLVLAGEARAAQVLAEDLAKLGVPALYAPSPSQVLPGQVLVLSGGLSAGMELPDGGAGAGIAVFTHGRNAALRQRPARRRSKEKGAAIHSLEELQINDYVVHAAHGIGRYEGVKQIDMQGIVKDYIQISYAKGDVLYVPVTQLDMVSKYIGPREDMQAKLHRLGGQEWQKAKTRVRAAVKDIADQLTRLYAARMATPGFAFEPDGEWQLDFERHFPYTETDDQLRCVEEIKADMERTPPMDRLLCGDVGFGKTEVALRAAFKCIAQGKQCALLVPTTILAFQHYQTVCARMEGFPVRVEMLSRFRTAAQQKDIIDRTRKGEIDILIGTHRMLSSDVRFRGLGLFIVDEEQRFGVAQKERIKELAPAVDVLTLSATPIPRTLNMAMSGIRDMSVIEEAPQDRHPVQTYVLEHDHGVLTDAIRRELRRGGQVYYLHNRIEDIERVAGGLQMRLPESRVGFAHGQMGEEQLSDIWRQVLEHELDILVCTTIIETGVDIANVNTLIIENADRYGLSQLHQIRGRVGRSSRRAYAYLTFTRGKVLTDISAKRLEAMRAFTEFGAGFKIALRDMEIRGAGNLLGAQQHGHMEAVGYDMYLRLLDEAVREQRGDAPSLREAECLIDLPVTAHIPDRYIETNGQRLEMYRRIADIRTQEDALDVTDELLDRYGEPPEAVRGLIEVALLRGMAAGLGIGEARMQHGSLLLYVRALDTGAESPVARLTQALRGRVLLSAGAKPYLAVKPRPGEDALETLREALLAMTCGAREGQES